MTTNSELDRTRQGTWLPVTKEGSTYVEVERDNKTCRFELISGFVELELVGQKVHRSYYAIALATSDARQYRTAFDRGCAETSNVRDRAISARAEVFGRATAASCATTARD